MKTAIRAAAAVAALLACGTGLWPAASNKPNNFRFAIVGDRTGEAQSGVYERVWREVDRAHPDFVINAGDVIQGQNDATADGEWRAAKTVWLRYRYPLFFTPGNHDIWSAASEKLYEKYTGRPPFYSFNYQDAHFTVLDNSRSENLGDDQMKFLERDLEQNRDRSPKFIFFHRPALWLIPLKFQSGEFALHQLARKYRVAVVVSGHTHQFLRLERDGVVYLNAGSSGGHLRGSDSEQGWYFGWTLAVVKGAEVELTVKKL
jgi:predicted phosphodiesterase